MKIVDYYKYLDLIVNLGHILGLGMLIKVLTNSVDKAMYKKYTLSKNQLKKIPPKDILKNEQFIKLLKMQMKVILIPGIALFFYHLRGGFGGTPPLSVKLNINNLLSSDDSANTNFLPFITLFKNNYMWIPSFFYIIYVLLNYFGFNLPIINLNYIMYYISLIGIISSSIMFIFKLFTFNYYLALKKNKKVKGISVLWPNFIKYQFELIRGISKINLPYIDMMIMELVFYAIMIIINSYGFFYIVI